MVSEILDRLAVAPRGRYDAAFRGSPSEFEHTQLLLTGRPSGLAAGFAAGVFHWRSEPAERPAPGIYSGFHQHRSYGSHTYGLRRHNVQVLSGWLLNDEHPPAGNVIVRR